jgi:hypothetical protein
MSDTQLYLSIGLPVLFNAVMFTVLILYIHAKIDALDSTLDIKIGAVNDRIDGLRNEMNARFEAQTQGLLRFEAVLDAHLKRLEER